MEIKKNLSELEKLWFSHNSPTPFFKEWEEQLNNQKNMGDLKTPLMDF